MPSIAEENISLLNLLKDITLGEGSPLELERLQNSLSSKNIIPYDKKYASAPTTFILTLLLLNGYEVSRSYDDDLMLVNWENAPKIWILLNPKNENFLKTSKDKINFFRSCVEEPCSIPEAEEFWEKFIHIDFPAGDPPKHGAQYYKIENTNEGLAKAIEILEGMTFNKEKDGLLILDFSKISDFPFNPLYWIRSFIRLQLNVIEPAKKGEIPTWEQALIADWCFEEEMGTNNSRLSTKSWRDLGIFDFIQYKNHNNSVMVDREFWELVKDESNQSKIVKHAKLVFDSIMKYSYETGEPNIINGDKLEDRKNGFGRKRPIYFNGEDCSSAKYQTNESKNLLANLCVISSNTRFPIITSTDRSQSLHVMGETSESLTISLMNGGCLPQALFRNKKRNENWDKKIEDSIRLGIRFLIRNNLRDSIYNKEILRSNRIGLGISEIIEWAWVRFGFTLKDLLDECKSNKFWKAISKFSKISKEEANSYSNYLGLNQPSTVLILNINEKFIELENAENQYRFIQLLEAFWLGTTQSGQIGWNLKIDTNQYSLDEYKKLILENQPLIKA